MPISSHLSNLPNQVIYGVMWSSDLKSCGKMLSNDIYMTYWSNLPNWAVYRVMWLLHWIPHQPKYFCPLYKHIYRYIPPYLASQLPAPGYCCEHHDVPCESTRKHHDVATQTGVRTQIYCRTSRGIHPEIHGIVFSLPIESTEYDRHSAGVCIFWRLPRNLKYFHIRRRFGRHFRPHSAALSILPVGV